MSDDLTFVPRLSHNAADCKNQRRMQSLARNDTLHTLEAWGRRGAAVRGRFLAAAAFVAGMFGAQDVSAANLGYDSKADPFEAYHKAIAAAKAGNKLVLVIAGGEWCRWCHVLDRFVARNPDVRQGLDDTFVVVKVYVGDENYNTEFFGQLPQAIGAPHFWIIAPDRNVLASQSTGALERGSTGYDKDKFLGFIEHWSGRAREDDLPRKTAEGVHAAPAPRHRS
jgi:hypothetical protein